MPEHVTKPSSTTSPLAPAVVAVRPLRYADLQGANAGDDEIVLYQLRDHAGHLSLDRSEIASTTSDSVYSPRRRHTPGNREQIGVKKSVAVRTVYGSETNVHLYDSTAAFDADFPSAYEGATAVERQRALAGQSDSGVYIEDPDGTTVLPVTPDWGSQVYLSMLVPDVDPDVLVTAIAKALDKEFPGHRLVKLQSRWVAERRVNVYRPDLQTGRRDGPSSVTHKPLASNVLEAEAFSFGQKFRVEQVSPSASRPAADG